MGSPALLSEAPNWETLGVELRCPQCAYDLRKLPQPRCPECGLAFPGWEELIAAAGEPETSPLFEYRWHRQPLRGFFGTLGRAFAPWRLWKQVPRYGRPRVGPLISLVVITVVLFVACFVVLHWALYQYEERAQSQITPSIRSSTANFKWYARDGVDHALHSVGVGAATWVVVACLRARIAREQLRRSQMVRVVVLAWLPIVLWLLVTGLVEVVLTEPLLTYKSCIGPYEFIGTRAIYDAPLALANAPYRSWLVFAEVPVLLCAVISLCLGLSRYAGRRGLAVGLLSAAGLVAIIVLTLLVSLWSGQDSWSLVILDELDSSWPGISRAAKALVLSG